MKNIVKLLLVVLVILGLIIGLIYTGMKIKERQIYKACYDPKKITLSLKNNMNIVNYNEHFCMIIDTETLKKAVEKIKNANP